MIVILIFGYVTAEASSKNNYLELTGRYTRFLPQDIYGEQTSELS